MGGGGTRLAGKSYYFLGNGPSWAREKEVDAPSRQAHEKVVRALQCKRAGGCKLVLCERLF